MKVYYRYHQFNSTSSLRTWICRIAVRTCLDHIAAQKRKKRFATVLRLVLLKDVDAALPIIRPDVALDQKEQLKILYSHIQQLPDRQKTAFILCRVEGYSQSDVAEIMGITTKAVDALVQRALIYLKKLS